MKCDIWFNITPKVLLIKPWSVIYHITSLGQTNMRLQGNKRYVTRNFVRGWSHNMELWKEFGVENDKKAVVL